MLIFSIVDCTPFSLFLWEPISQKGSFKIFFNLINIGIRHRLPRMSMNLVSQLFVEKYHSFLLVENHSFNLWNLLIPLLSPDKNMSGFTVLFHYLIKDHSSKFFWILKQKQAYHWDREETAKNSTFERRESDKGNWGDPVFSFHFGCFFSEDVFVVEGVWILCWCGIEGFSLNTELGVIFWVILGIGFVLFFHKSFFEMVPIPSVHERFLDVIYCVIRKESSFQWVIMTNDKGTIFRRIQSVRGTMITQIATRIYSENTTCPKSY